MKIRKVITILPLVILGFLVSFSAAGRLRFGYGLGDIFYYGLVYTGFLVYGIYFIVKRKVLEKVNLIFPLITIAFCIYIILEMTIWRGVEYKWNGDILAPTEQTRKEITRKKFEDELAKHANTYKLSQINICKIKFKNP